MAYDIKLNLPAGWSQKTSSVLDENGNEAVHLEASSEALAIDIYIGELPEDTTPEDQAFSNYADMVGFDDEAEDDGGGDSEDVGGDSEVSCGDGKAVDGVEEQVSPEEYPIVQIKFNGKKAWGFEAFCEDGSLVAVLTQEIKSGILAVINVNAPDDPSIQSLLQLVESGLRIKKS